VRELQLGSVTFFWQRLPLSADDTFEYPGSYEDDCELLSEDERSRSARFVFARDRIHFVAAHALVRRALSTYLPLRADEWRFTTNAFGRPEVAGTDVEPRLRFNLSHTDGLVACAVTRGNDVGVDVETLQRGAPIDIAEDVLTQSELAALRELPISERPSRFLEYWTLKEAYVKARGLGLSLPLRAFAFHRDERGEIGVIRDPSLNDQETWQFISWRIEDAFQVAVAIGAGTDRP